MITGGRKPRRLLLGSICRIRWPAHAVREFVQYGLQRPSHTLLRAVRGQPERPKDHLSGVERFVGTALSEPHAYVERGPMRVRVIERAPLTRPTAAPDAWAVQRWRAGTCRRAWLLDALPHDGMALLAGKAIHQRYTQ